MNRKCIFSLVIHGNDFDKHKQGHDQPHSKNDSAPRMNRHTHDPSNAVPFHRDARSFRRFGMLAHTVLMMFINCIIILSRA